MIGTVERQETSDRWWSVEVKAGNQLLLVIGTGEQQEAGDAADARVGKQMNQMWLIGSFQSKYVSQL